MYWSEQFRLAYMNYCDCNEVQKDTKVCINLCIETSALVSSVLTVLCVLMCDTSDEAYA